MKTPCYHSPCTDMRVDPQWLTETIQKKYCFFFFQNNREDYIETVNRFFYLNAQLFFSIVSIYDKANVCVYNSLMLCTFFSLRYQVNLFLMSSFLILLLEER